MENEFSAPDEGKMYPVYPAVIDPHTGEVLFLNPVDLDALFERGGS